MTILDIISAPNIVLKQPCDPVTIFDSSLKKLIKNMFETMESAQGIGLAAPQIGLLEQIFIVKCHSVKLVCINPIVTCTGELKFGEESCLSIPNTTIEVPRYPHVSIKAYNENGTLFQKQFSGLLAIVIQHEYDHLNGILITDKLSKNNPISIQN